MLAIHSTTFSNISCIIICVAQLEKTFDKLSTIRDTVYVLIFRHPKYSSFATKGCDSALIDDEI